MVAPLAGAWIEITSETVVAGEEDVAPLAGAWIEIPRHPRRRKRREVALHARCVD